MANSFQRDSIACQAESTVSGVRKVVSSTRSTLRPSTPTW